jgi:exoribonuclease II
MSIERELLTQAAERLARHSVNIPDLMLGDKIFKHLHATKKRERAEPEQQLEQED